MIGVLEKIEPVQDTKNNNNNTSLCYFQNVLPNEIKCYILSFLSVYPDLYQAVMVSKSWHSYARYEILNKRSVFSSKCLESSTPNISWSLVPGFQFKSSPSSPNLLFQREDLSLSPLPIPLATATYLPGNDGSSSAYSCRPISPPSRFAQSMNVIHLNSFPFLLMFGGSTYGRAGGLHFYNDVMLYDITNSVWYQVEQFYTPPNTNSSNSNESSHPSMRSFATSHVIGSSEILFIGGQFRDTTNNNAWQFFSDIYVLQFTCPKRNSPSESIQSAMFRWFKVNAVEGETDKPNDRVGHRTVFVSTDEEQKKLTIYYYAGCSRNPDGSYDYYDDMWRLEVFKRNSNTNSNCSSNDNITWERLWVKVDVKGSPEIPCARHSCTMNKIKLKYINSNPHLSLPNDSSSSTTQKILTKEKKLNKKRKYGDFTSDDEGNYNDNTKEESIHNSSSIPKEDKREPKENEQEEKLYFIIFGGNRCVDEWPCKTHPTWSVDERNLNDLWLFDIEDSTWHEIKMVPKHSSASLPVGRWSHCGITIGADDQIMIFGGFRSNNARGDFLSLRDYITIKFRVRIKDNEREEREGEADWRRVKTLKGGSEGVKLEYKWDEGNTVGKESPDLNLMFYSSLYAFDCIYLFGGSARSKGTASGALYILK